MRPTLNKLFIALNRVAFIFKNKTINHINTSFASGNKHISHESIRD